MTNYVFLIVTLFLGCAAEAGFKAYNSTTDLGLVQSYQCSTGLTCTKVGTKVQVTSSPTLATSVTLTAAEATNSYLLLQADESDDSGDDWKIASVASGNALIFYNDTSGSEVAKLSISTAGVLSLSDSETITNASGVVTIGFDDAAGNLKVNAFEATNANFVLQADESDDNGDDWQVASVASDDSFTISNDTSGSMVAKFTMSTAGAITLVGSVTGDGGDAMSGFLHAQVASTTASITAAQCGSTFVSNSADVMALPEASTVLGCRITFVSGTADDFDINPADGTDQIGSITASGGTITPAAGDAIRITDIGSSVTLEAVGNDLWVAVGHNGAITDVN